MKSSLSRNALCSSWIFIASCALLGARVDTKTCGSPSAPLAQSLTWAVEKMTVDGDTDVQEILQFPSITPAVWVTNEHVCRKILATVDKLWPAPRGGPVYVMQLGKDYAVIQGDKKSGRSRAVMHVDAAFRYIASIVWQ